MALAHFQQPVTNGSGDLQPGTVVTVTNEATGALAVLKSDRNGSSGKSNPLTVGSDGILDFYAAGGAYRIAGVLGAFSFDWRYVGIGTAGEFDIDSLLTPRRAAVRVATTANITISTALNNGDTLDGVTLATNDLVLVKDQTTKSQNGVYVVGVSPARHADFDTYDEHVGALVAVSAGTAGANTVWLCSANIGGTLNTTEIVFTKIQSVAGQQGPSGTIAVGTVDDVPYGDPATVTNSGTSTAAIFDFEIPGGPPGQVGEGPYVDHGTVTTGTETIDRSAHVMHRIEAGGDFAVDFSGWPASGTLGEVLLEIVNGGAHTITWPGSLNWLGGSPPSLQSSGTDFIVVFTRNGGSALWAKHG